MWNGKRPISIYCPHMKIRNVFWYQPLPPPPSWNIHIYRKKHALFYCLKCHFEHLWLWMIKMKLRKKKKRKIVVFGLKILKKSFNALYFGAQPPTFYWFVDDKIDKTWNDNEILLYRHSHLLRYASNNGTTNKRLKNSCLIFSKFEHTPPVCIRCSFCS